MFKSSKPKTKRERSTSTTGHYVRNSDLLPAIIEAKQHGKVTNKLIVMIQKIAERYSRKSNFIGYSFREDMVSAAVENLCKNALKFNHEKYNNPFAFYTTAIHHSFLQFMSDEKRHRNIRDALLIDAGSNPSFNFLEVEKDESAFDVKESDEIKFEIEKENAADEVEAPTAATSEEEAPAQNEVRIGRRERLPGAVTVWKPEDMVQDERGIWIPKPLEEVVAAKVRSSRGRKKKEGMVTE
jgi:DNA-directed RNA polymerase specialized sigma subunit